MADFSSAFNSWFDRKVENLNRRTFRALEGSMKEGEEITQTFIATRGTSGTGGVSAVAGFWGQVGTVTPQDYDGFQTSRAYSPSSAVVVSGSGVDSFHVVQYDGPLAVRVYATTETSQVYGADQNWLSVWSA